MNNLADNAVVAHHERMRYLHFEVVAHAFELGSLHRYLAVVDAGNHARQEQVDTARAGDDAEIEIDPERIYLDPVRSNGLWKR